MSDFIDRQAALDAMAELHARATTKAEYKGISKAWKRIKQLPSALGANLAEVGTDCISRQAAIDRIRGTGYADQIKENVIMILMGVPSAQPEPLKIDLSGYSEEDWERLKKEWGNTPITVLSAQPDIVRCRDCRYYNHEEKECLDLLGHGRRWEEDDFCSYGAKMEVTT